MSLIIVGYFIIGLITALGIVTLATRSEKYSKQAIRISSVVMTIFFWPGVFAYMAYSLSSNN